MDNRVHIYKNFAVLRIWLVLCCAAIAGQASAQTTLSPGFAEGGKHLSPSERAGREIWFFATAFNDRFFTYAYQQRLGAIIDWYGILGAKNRHSLFQITNYCSLSICFCLNRRC